MVWVQPKHPLVRRVGAGTSYSWSSDGLNLAMLKSVCITSAGRRLLQTPLPEEGTQKPVCRASGTGVLPQWASGRPQKRGNPLPRTPPSWEGVSGRKPKFLSMLMLQACTAKSSDTYYL
jgi:hypothetical protein